MPMQLLQDYGERIIEEIIDEKGLRVECKQFIFLLTYQKSQCKSIFRSIFDMAQTVKSGGFLYRINPCNDKELQRCSIGATSWSRVCDFNGNHILDLLLADNGRDIEVHTDRYVYIRTYSGQIHKK